MKTKICLSQKVVLFYAILTPVIIFASLYNLIEGVILQHTATYRLGPFSLFGFVIMPVIVFAAYFKNICIITTDTITINKVNYPFSDYKFTLAEKELALQHRPLTSLFKKYYHYLIITDRKTNNIVLEKDLEVFDKSLNRIKELVPFEN
ncbi:hypothetical protein D0C36_23730 [Mucilaginibacter conchicola]|uniref:Uncharacterized protein n=1 Tax=Mucilaginibacter conchicola TaxID=2303333 RepID=A0A372NM01_9SPHI|nr:hypothetical protein [Mucilaginibacter conchicola]RFZ89971.1 hypothetical protein D0C36_23730 [Mucilaginibacter conchicola]